ncbi:hypothetical protein PF005_g28790 [Phytophthora fragariae]|uniref:RxLR effector protein n=1 Tax=Phytophthora fragariae TaxID=53985 RepID=A0A6A3VHX6_9STRA|nr:hypothetical protein PF003_g3127 [Phytophthora fragariae]KAE8920406.1 hypothetical protein PF009_g29297 [Phytophthora fragariae]KAE8966735.1 hypothetical protein PF011_g27828 [Phytophthora fragariae]KAE9064968.1 hypothetical protein PF010_g28407 [Phytophthora fragariae]KAE9065914.1 hypothetical protein PF007_g28677 [Phytophthora fragariae]
MVRYLCCTVAWLALQPAMPLTSRPVSPYLPRLYREMRSSPKLTVDDRASCRRGALLSMALNASETPLRGQRGAIGSKPAPRPPSLSVCGQRSKGFSRAKLSHRDIPCSKSLGDFQ